jgi:hypothetical protein
MACNEDQNSFFHSLAYIVDGIVNYFEMLIFYWPIGPHSFTKRRYLLTQYITRVGSGSGPNFGLGLLLKKALARTVSAFLLVPLSRLSYLFINSPY